MKMYLAGPMSGIPQFNYPRFDYVAGELRQLGVDVLSPAEMDDEHTRELALASEDGSLAGWAGTETWGEFLSRDVKIVADEVDAVCMLENWNRSRGARLEAFVALQVMKPVYVWNDKNGLTELTDEIVMDAIYWGTIKRDMDKETRYG